MDQFRICRARAGRAGSKPTFVVVLQRETLQDIRTRLVAPLLPSGQVVATAKLHPQITVEGVDYVVMVERMAAVDMSTLTKTTHSAAAIRDQLVRAVDFLITG